MRKEREKREKKREKLGEEREKSSERRSINICGQYVIKHKIAITYDYRNKW